MEFKLNQKMYLSLMAMLDDYKASDAGSMELVDHEGRVIAHIDPTTHLSGVDLSGCDLSGLDLSDADLSHADLSNTNLSTADLSHANLSNAVLSDADLRYADLSHAVLSDADLRNADLSHAVLSDAHLCGAVLRHAVLRHAVLRHAVLSDADLFHANLFHANLFHADLSHAVLSYADLSHADLSNADLSHAHIITATMYGAALNGATIGELPSSLLIPRGKLIGYKKIVGKDGVSFIAKLLVKKGTPRTKATTNKMRAKSVVVLGFYDLNGERSKRTIGYSAYDREFVYRVGKINCTEWERDRWLECSGGIHFFLALRDAVEYTL